MPPELPRPPLPGLDSVPPALRGLRQWVAWRYVQKPGRPKLDKVPFMLEGKVTLGRSVGEKVWKVQPKEAKPNAPSGVWMRLEDVLDLAPRVKSQHYGPGFMFTEAGGVVGIDIDNCRDVQTGELTPFAEDVVARFPTYWEISPSGKGLHGYLFGVKPTGDCKNSELGIEIYSDKRYFTFSGWRLAWTPRDVIALPDALNVLCGELWPPKPPEPPRPYVAPRTASLSDLEVIERARRADDGGRFARLWDGEVKNSEADFALAASLCFWVGRDETRIRGLMLMSGLVRAKKWFRAGDDYLARTIGRAMASQTEFFGQSSGGAANANFVDGVDISDLINGNSGDLNGSPLLSGSNAVPHDPRQSDSVKVPTMCLRDNKEVTLLGLSHCPIDAPCDSRPDSPDSSFLDVATGVRTSGVRCDAPILIQMRDKDCPARHVICAMRCNRCDGCTTWKTAALIDHFGQLITRLAAVFVARPHEARWDGVRHAVLRSGGNHVTIKPETGRLVIASSEFVGAELCEPRPTALRFAETLRAIPVSSEKRYTSSREWAFRLDEPDARFERLATMPMGNIDAFAEWLERHGYRPRPFSIQNPRSAFLSGIEQVFPDGMSKEDVAGVVEQGLRAALPEIVGRRRTRPQPEGGQDEYWDK